MGSPTLGAVLTWEDLAGHALARQFGVRVLDGGTVGAAGPMQTQTARAAFLALATRSEMAYDDLTQAYRDGRLVRGSNIRGTVHTLTPAQQRVLDAVSRIGLRRSWQRWLGLEDVEALWKAVDDFAAQWRTPAEVAEFTTRWLVAHGLDAAIMTQPQGRFLSLSIGLVRMPANGDWAGQGAPLYRSARVHTGLPLPTPDRAVEQAIELHVRAHGPSSREDIAWWSGLPQRVVTAGIERLSLVSYDGPLGRAYVDLPGSQISPHVEIPGLRLLPEFDALLCAYDSKARDRFVSPELHPLLFNAKNGLCRPPVLIDGRIGGVWRATGSAKKRPLEITYFPGTRRPTDAELAEAVGQVEAGLAIAVTGVSVTPG